MLTLDFIRQAAARVRPFVHRTPVLTSRTFDEAAGRRVFFKCENFQRAGAFKMRGATNKILSLSGEERARRLSEREGLTVVPPYDDYYVAAGQGTCALELFEDVPDLDALVTPCGGGGLFAGASTAAKAVRPGVRCFPVESELSDHTRQSFLHGERVTIPPPATVADGMRTQTP